MDCEVDFAKLCWQVVVWTSEDQEWMGRLRYPTRCESRYSQRCGIVPDVGHATARDAV